MTAKKPESANKVKVVKHSDSPLMVKLDRDKPLARFNPRLVSARAGALIEVYSKHKMLDVLDKSPDSGWAFGRYTREEVTNIASFIDN